MDMTNLSQYVGRKVMRVTDNMSGRVAELGNYDEDDDVEFKVVLENGEEVIVETDAGFEATGLKLL